MTFALRSSTRQRRFVSANFRCAQACDFLIDECLRPLVADGLRVAGHDAIHVGLLGATDEQVMSLAAEHSRVVVSADTDFGELLARDRLGLPSVILLRRNHDPADQVRTILDALVDVADDLLAGAIVVIVEDRLRIRRLPIR